MSWRVPLIIRSMIGHVRGVLSTYRSDAITLIVLQPDMVYANLWALRHSYSFHSVIDKQMGRKHHYILVVIGACIVIWASRQVISFVCGSWLVD